MKRISFVSKVLKLALSLTGACLCFLSMHPSALYATPLATSSLATPENIPKPLKVGVGLILNNLISLNEQSGIFEADVDLSLTWTDANLAFDPKKEGTTLLTLDAEQTAQELKSVWTPKIVITNIQKIVSDEPSMTIIPDGTVTYIQRIKADFKTNPDLKSFPFDSQSLTFYLDALDNTTNEIQFTQSQQDINHSGVRTGVSLAGWTMKGIDFSHSLARNAKGGYYPRFEAKISMDRISWPHLFAFAPLLLIMLSPTIITLYSDSSTVGTRLTAWGAALLTLIATMFALNQKYPALQSDSILPQMTSIMMTYQFVMIVISMTFLNPAFTQRFKNPYIVSEVVSYLRWSIPAIFSVFIVMRVLLAMG